MADIAMSTKIVRVFLLFFPAFFQICASCVNAMAPVTYDVDELRRISYRIDILDTPLSYDNILLNHYDAANSKKGIMLSNKFGQPFHCSYDTTTVKPADHDDNTDAFPDDSKRLTALNELLTQYCLTRTYHWWTYEVCYSQNVTQYHMEDGRRSGDVITLGLFESDFDWNASNVIESDEFVHRFHSQRYVNGTACEPTAGLRSVLVKFTCENENDETNDAEVNIIYDVSEVTTCQYVVSMRIEKLCRLKRLRRDFRRSTVSIECHPVSNKHHDRIRVRRDADVMNNIKLESPVKGVVIDVSKNPDAAVIEFLTASVTHTDESVSKELVPNSPSFIEPNETPNAEDNRVGDRATSDNLPISTRQSAANDASVIVSDALTPVNDASKIANDASKTVNDVSISVMDSPKAHKDSILPSQKDVDSPFISASNGNTPELPEKEAETDAIISTYAKEMPVTKMKFYRHMSYYNEYKEQETSSDKQSTTQSQKEITEIEVMHVNKLDNPEEGQEEIGDSYMKWTGPGGKVYRITTNELTATVTVYTPSSEGDFVVEESGELDEERTRVVGPTALERVKKEMIEGPERRTEIKIINTEYYDENGKPVAKKGPSGFKKEVVATFRKNDEEMTEFEKHRTLERRYNALREDDGHEEENDVESHFD